MRKEDLFESMTAIEDELIERSERGAHRLKYSKSCPEGSAEETLRDSAVTESAAGDGLDNQGKVKAGEKPGRSYWVKWGCTVAVLALLLGVGGYLTFRPAGEWGSGEQIASLPGETGNRAEENSIGHETGTDTGNGSSQDAGDATDGSAGEASEDGKTGQETDAGQTAQENNNSHTQPDIQPDSQGMQQGDAVPGQTGTPGQVGFETPKGGTEVAAGSVDIGMLLNKVENAQEQSLCITIIPVGEYKALYEQLFSRSEEVLKTSKGALVEGTENCYRLAGHTDLQYLIMEGEEEGSYTLWEFAYFLQDTEYAFEDVLRLIYGIDSAQDIVRIVSRPANMDGSDRGKALQQEIGEKTIEDREQIETLYRVIASMNCLGNNRWDLVGLGGDRPEEVLEAVRKGRYLTLVTVWENEIDKLKYTGISGMFYQYSGVAYDSLGQEDREAVEEILEIE